MTDPTTSAEEVLLRVQGGLGRVTLNRPRAINALNHRMVISIAAALTQWADDDAVTAVVLDGAGERGLCAGGDIRAIYHDATSGGTASLDFWFDEYRLNNQIATYPKPVVALMDGLVMGGGVGLSAHASHRVVTERTVVGMPEVNIGLIPDVGGTYLLARAPGLTGLHAGLTAASITGIDAIALGMADRSVPHGDQSALIERIAEVGPDAALAELSADTTTSELLAARSWIDECYAANTVEEILATLRAHPASGAQAAAQAIGAASPTSLKLTLTAVRAAAGLDLPAALNQEFRLVSALLRAPDLAEGIRAQVIDKDRNPRWTPAHLEDVTGEIIGEYFAPTPRAPFALADSVTPAPAGAAR